MAYVSLLDLTQQPVSGEGELMGRIGVQTGHIVYIAKR